MKFILLFVVPSLSIAGALNPAPYPVFLKAGFSSVLEFDDSPTRVVLGDSQNFQIEKLEKSLVIRTLSNYAVGNMFVYFKNNEPKLFLLRASEDAEPTYYRKFQEPKIQVPAPVAPHVAPSKLFSGGRVLLAKFDEKKDYLTLEIEVTADSKAVLKPNWSLVRLGFNSSAIAPNKLWAERQDVQRDSRVKARFIFFKPNIPRNLKDVSLIIPIQGQATAMKLKLNRGAG